MDGGERSLLETVEALRVRGVTCKVLVPGEGPLLDHLRDRGIESRILSYRWWVGPEGGAMWRRALRILRALAWTVPVYLRIRRWGTDLVYTNTLTVPVGAFAAALARCPHVWHIRELGHENNRLVFDLGERRALRIMDRLSAIFLVNSRCVAEKYLDAFGPRKIKIVHQAVRTDWGRVAVKVPPRSGFRCVTVGALSPRKRQEEAIEAVHRLRSEGLSPELLIIGEGDRDYEVHLRRLVERYGLSETVLFLGKVDSAYPFIEDADVVVTCSRREAFGRVTVEAMLAGRPVIGARSGGTAELIRDGFNGFLYEAGDVGQLAARLRALIERPEEGRKIGAAAREWAAGRFTEERYGGEVMEALLGASGAGSSAAAGP
jgi:glycosyltransferase involved in cell wall biosynthesis